MLALILAVPYQLHGAQKLSTPDLIALARAKPESKELSEAMRVSFRPEALSKGHAVTGVGATFLWAIEAESQPQLIVDDKPMQALRRIPKSNLWFVIADVKTGEAHLFFYRVNGKTTGSVDIPAYGPDSYQQEGVPEDQWCYETNAQGDVIALKKNYLSLDGYRLPTEAEWEYCCRAGTNTRFSFGDKIKMQDEAVFRVDETIEYGIAHPTAQANNRNMPLPVNHKNAKFPDLDRAPNNFGLLDMHGNVWEWCMDFYSDQLPGGSVTDPTGPGSAPSNWHVMRGGAYDENASKCRSATRKGEAPNIRDKAVGFRVVFAATKK